MKTSYKSYKSLTLVGILVAGIAVAGCSKSEQGTLAGAAIGGILGSTVGKGNGKLIAIGLGTAVGAMLGGSIGSQLDEMSKRNVHKNVSQTLESYPDGQSGTWQDPNRSISSTTLPTRTFQTSGGEYCREFQQEIQIAGQKETAYGTACRQTDGNWKIVG